MKKIDLTGKIFGGLYVIRESEKAKYGRLAWECQCECGNKTITTTSDLTKGSVKSCGCRTVQSNKKKKRNILNQKFGLLTVLKQAPNIVNSIAWLCLCDCGNEKIIKGTRLTSGNTTTCGCRSDRIIRKNPEMDLAERIFNEKYSDGNITFEQFYTLSKMNCFYCNSEPSNGKNRISSRKSHAKRGDKFLHKKEIGAFIYNGLDRVDSSKVHYIDNVVPCCKNCNLAKLMMTFDEFKKWIIRIYNHWAK